MEGTSKEQILPNTPCACNLLSILSITQFTSMIVLSTIILSFTHNGTKTWNAYLIKHSYTLELLLFQRMCDIDKNVQLVFSSLAIAYRLLRVAGY